MLSRCFKHIHKREYFIQQPNGGTFHQSQNSLNRSQDYSNDCFARPMKPISPLKKRPVPTPRSDILHLSNLLKLILHQTFFH